MSLPASSGPYALGPDEGEALWFNGGLGILKATGVQTGGRFTLLELRPPKRFGAPLHPHAADHEFIVVLAGEFLLRYGEAVVEAPPCARLYTSRRTAL